MAQAFLSTQNVLNVVKVNAYSTLGFIRLVKLSGAVASQLVGCNPRMGEKPILTQKIMMSTGKSFIINIAISH